MKARAAVALALVLAACGVKAPPRPPISPGDAPPPAPAAQVSPAGTGPAAGTTTTNGATPCDGTAGGSCGR